MTMHQVDTFRVFALHSQLLCQLLFTTPPRSLLSNPTRLRLVDQTRGYNLQSACKYTLCHLEAVLSGLVLRSSVFFWCLFLLPLSGTFTLHRANLKQKDVTKLLVVYIHARQTSEEPAYDWWRAK